MQHTLAKLESETVATGKTGLLKTGKSTSWPTEETLKYNVWIEV